MSGLGDATPGPRRRAWRPVYMNFRAGERPGSAAKQPLVILGIFGRDGIAGRPLILSARASGDATRQRRRAGASSLLPTTSQPFSTASSRWRQRAYLIKRDGVLRRQILLAQRRDVLTTGNQPVSCPFHALHTT